MSPFVSEIIGTAILITLGLAVNANCSLKGTHGKGGGWIVITVGWGLAVFCGVSVAGPYSGAHINPAVTLGLAVAGTFPWEDVPVFILAQMIGALLGGFIVWLNFKNHFNVEENKETKLGVFSTSPAIKDTVINFLCEVTGTFILVYVIFYITEPNLEASGLEDVKIGLGSVGALPVALLVMVIGMGLGGTTGYSINPARDLGPRIMHALLPIEDKGPSNWNYAWIPVFGPLAGGALAAGIYLWLG